MENRDAVFEIATVTTTLRVSRRPPTYAKVRRRPGMKMAGLETLGSKERIRLLIVSEKEDLDFVISGIQSGDEAFAAIGVAA